jgi:protein-disulfide isomerase
MNSPDFSRRAALGGAAAGLAGLAGCSSVGGLFGGGPSAGGSSPDENESGNQSSGSAASLLHASAETTPTGIDLAGNPIAGASDAPVDMYYWSDFQCPFCNRFEQNALPKLLENEVADGRLRIVLLELPNIGSASRTAARMAKCVWRRVKETRPDAYHRWHATVYDNQGEPNSGWATRKRLHEITESVDGVDAGAVHGCMDDRREAMQALVEDDVAQAREHGVSVTPGFVLYGRGSGTERAITGAQPYPRFRKEIADIARS